MSPRVTEEYAELRKRQILTAAWESFAERGVRGTTIRGIAESLGLSTGMVYTYFDSKEEIVQALLDMSLRQNQELLAQLAEKGSAREAIGDLVGFLGECCTEEEFRASARANLVSWAEALEDDVFRDGFRKAFEQLHQGLSEVTGRGVRSGELPEDLDPDALARFILAVIQGVKIQAALLKDVEMRPVLELTQQLICGSEGGMQT